MFDSDPAKIVGLLGRRDDDLDSDWFTFAVDPYLDRRSGFSFSVNPAGSIIDRTLYNDEWDDSTWDGIWESAARVDDKGWTVEMRIPYDQLRFTVCSEYVWGVNFKRTIQRKNEQDYFSWVPKEENGFVSRFARLTGIRGIRPGRHFEAMPYTVGKLAFSPREDGQSLSHRQRPVRQRRPRPEVRPEKQPDPRPFPQPRFRPGRGRSGRGQPVGIRNVLFGKAAFFHRRGEYFQLSVSAAPTATGDSTGAIPNFFTAAASASRRAVMSTATAMSITRRRPPSWARPR